MIDTKYIEHINKEIDGLNTPEESIALREYLSDNPEAQKLFDELMEISRMLESVPPIEPSQNLKKYILNDPVTQHYVPRNNNIGHFFLSFVNNINPLTLFLNLQESVMKKQKYVLAAIVVAIVFVGYMSFFYPWPSSSDVQGTIGGVKKYNASQMSDKDVTLATPSSERDHKIMEAFAKLDAAQKAALLDQMEVAQKAVLLDQMEVAQKTDVLSKLDAAQKAALLDQMEVAQKAALLDQMEVAQKVDVLSKLDAENKASPPVQ